MAYLNLKMAIHVKRLQSTNLPIWSPLTSADSIFFLCLQEKAGIYVETARAKDQCNWLHIQREEKKRRNNPEEKVKVKQSTASCSVDFINKEAIKLPHKITVKKS